MNKVIGFEQGPTSSGMMTWYAARLDCGHAVYSDGWKPFPSTVCLGTEFECQDCINHHAACNRLESLNLSEVAYLRFNTRFGGRYLAYRRDKESPTGVINFDAFPATKEIDEIIDRRHIPTLSPTEGRTRAF